MKPSRLVALLPFLAGSAATFGQSMSPAGAQEVVITTFCAKSGSMQIATGTMRCNGAWTLTLQPSGGTAAHLVGGMSTMEVKAVLDATGIAYTTIDSSSLKAGKFELRFGGQGLEAFARPPGPAATGT